MLPEQRKELAQVSEYDKNLDAFCSSLTTITGLDINKFLRFDGRKLKTQPISANFGAKTQSAIQEQVRHEVFGSGTEYSLIKILEIMRNDLQRKELNLDRANLLAYLVEFIDLTKDKPGDVIDSLNDELFVLAEELKTAFEIDDKFISVHQTYNHLVFNKLLNGQARRFLVMTALKQSLQPNQEMSDQDWLEQVIIPFKKDLSDSLGKRVKLTSEWQELATGSQPHFSRKMEIRRQKQGSDHQFAKWDAKVGPGRHST